MRFNTLIGVAILLIGIATSARISHAAEVVVTLYNLPPNLTPIEDDTVIVQVFEPLFQPDGEVIRDANDRIRNGTPILSQPLRPTPGGRFTIAIPPNGQATRIVNMQFRRSGQAVTQVLSGVVVVEGQPYRLDVTVPEQLPTRCYYVRPCRCFRRLRWCH